LALKIFWTIRAEKKFEKIIQYLLDTFGEKSARVFTKKVFMFLEILVDFPELGSIENIDRGIRGFTLTRQVNIFYSVSGEKIFLLDFFDNRQDPNKKRF
jgi:plasmid stabilization system protein ParE